MLRSPSPHYVYNNWPASLLHVARTGGAGPKPQPLKPLGSRDRGAEVGGAHGAATLDAELLGAGLESLAGERSRDDLVTADGSGIERLEHSLGLLRGDVERGVALGPERVQLREGGVEESLELGDLDGPLLDLRHLASELDERGGRFVGGNLHLTGGRLTVRVLDADQGPDGAVVASAEVAEVPGFASSVFGVGHDGSFSVRGLIPSLRI